MNLRKTAMISVMAGVLAHAVTVRAEQINVGNEEFKRLLAQGVPLVDVRTAGEWRQTGVVAGSRLITLFDEQGGSDPAGWVKEMDRVAGPGAPVVIICRSGNRSGKAAQLLLQRDPKRKVYNVQEGIAGWARAGQAVVSLQENLKQTGGACSPRC